MQVSESRRCVILLLLSRFCSSKLFASENRVLSRAGKSLTTTDFFLLNEKFEMEDGKEATLTPSIEQIHESEEPKTPELKQDHGVTLIPRPSDDPRDPLVRSMSYCSKDNITDEL